MSQKENSPLACVVFESSHSLTIVGEIWECLSPLLSLFIPLAESAASSESVHKWSGATPASRSNRKKRLSTLAQYIATACVVSLGGAKFQHSHTVESARATERQLKFQLQSVYLWAIQHNSRKPHWVRASEQPKYIMPFICDGEK